MDAVLLLLYPEGRFGRIGTRSDRCVFRRLSLATRKPALLDVSGRNPGFCHLFNRPAEGSRENYQIYDVGPGSYSRNPGYPFGNPARSRSRTQLLPEV